MNVFRSAATQTIAATPLIGDQLGTILSKVSLFITHCVPDTIFRKIENPPIIHYCLVAIYPELDFPDFNEKACRGLSSNWDGVFLPMNTKPGIVVFTLLQANSRPVSQANVLKIRAYSERNNFLRSWATSRYDEYFSSKPQEGKELQCFFKKVKAVNYKEKQIHSYS